MHASTAEPSPRKTELQPSFDFLGSTLTLDLWPGGPFVFHLGATVPWMENNSGSIVEGGLGVILLQNDPWLVMRDKWGGVLGEGIGDPWFVLLDARVRQFSLSHDYHAENCNGYDNLPSCNSKGSISDTVLMLGAELMGAPWYHHGAGEWLNFRLSGHALIGFADQKEVTRVYHSGSKEYDAEPLEGFDMAYSEMAYGFLARVQCSVAHISIGTYSGGFVVEASLYIPLLFEF